MKSNNLTSQAPSIPASKSKQLRSLFLGGILPVLAFSFIEDRWGTLWGLVAGMVFGVGEIVWEWRTQGKVEAMTWGGNGMLLLLGGISLVTQEGIWFKLQPSLIEMAMAVVLWGSVLMKKPLLVSLAQKQGSLPLDLEKGLRPGFGVLLPKLFQGLTLRLGLFFGLHAVIAAWAALDWSTAAWAALKGIGFTLSLIVYLVVESIILRYRLASIP